MKTQTNYQKQASTNEAFVARNLLYAFILMIMGLSRVFAQAPAAPIADSASNNTCTAFNANWGSVSTATTYYLDVSSEQTFVGFLPGYNNLNVGNVLTYNITGVMAGGTYYYRVRAANGNGASANSNTITVVIGPIATATPANPIICSGQTANIALSSNSPGTTYSWTVWQNGVTGASAGSGSVISQQLTNTGPNSGSVYYTITPSQNGCSGQLLWVSTTVMNCQQGGSGITFTSPLDGATINSRCDLKFCINDLTNANISVSVLDTTLNSVAYINVDSLGIHCSPIDQYYIGTVAAGLNTFYLYYNGVFYDTLTVNVSAPIASLHNQTTFSQTPTTNGGYDFVISGLSANESYKVIAEYFNNSASDTLLVSNATSATISHQFSHNGTYYGGFTVISDCDNAISYDTIFANVTNSLCSSFIDFSYGSIAPPQSCAGNTVVFNANVNFGGVSPNDSSQIQINWGDGNTQTIFISHNGSSDSTISISNISHQYSSPGSYTAFAILHDANACSIDSLIQYATIGSNTCGNLIGTIFGDANANCTQDIGEGGVPYVVVMATMNGNTYWAWTDSAGNYAFNFLPSGTYTLQIGDMNQSYSLTCNNTTAVITSGTLTLNFGVSCNGFDVAINNIWLEGEVFPGVANSTVVETRISGIACNPTPISGTVKLVLNGCTQYTNPYIAYPPDSIISASTGDTLVWNTSDLSTFMGWPAWSYGVNLTTCTNAQIGDTVCMTAIVTPNVTGDIDMSNNTFTRCFAVGVSYDPNSKEVMPAGSGSQGLIPVETPELTYTINFQNTGTATAHNIYVLDTIDTDLQYNSIEILNASHKMQVYSLPNRVVKFMFADIMLADSAHSQLHSHGYVTFKIKTNTNLAAGTQIKNTGYIYFDYNEPVVTNTALNTIEMTAGVTTLHNDPVEFNVYPNPAKDRVIVSSSEKHEGKITLMDVVGKVVKEQKTYEAQTEVSLSDLPEGIYFIKLTQGNVCSTKKIVVNK